MSIPDFLVPGKSHLRGALRVGLLTKRQAQFAPDAFIAIYDDYLVRNNYAKTTIVGRQHAAQHASPGSHLPSSLPELVSPLQVQHPSS